MATTEIQFRIDVDKKEAFKKACGDAGMAKVLKRLIDEYIERSGKNDK